ncbi:hypothetical protein PAPHI01_0100 [Pancytospora philotis]|nr:hypothetical protein PAPHI01_0100 [Pancytospora philotis]
MVTLQDIKRSMSIPEAPAEKHELAGIVEQRAGCGGEPATSLEALNQILARHGLPLFSASDSCAEQLAKLAQMGAAGADIPIDCDAAQQKLGTIEEWRSVEARCDMHEVELANTNGCASSEHSNLTLQELQQRAAECRGESAALKSFMPEELALVKQLLSGEPSEALAEHLGHLHDVSRGAYLRHRASEALSGRTDAYSRIIVLIMSGVRAVDDLCSAMDYGRVELLRAIYHLCSKDILCYNRLTDCVSLYN